MTNANAELISTGNELLSGRTVNIHAQVLGEALGALGIRLVRDTTLGDDEEILAGAVADALARTPIVFVSGGLGPTSDDITREAVARIVHAPIVIHGEARRSLEAIYRHRNREVTGLALRQAMVLDAGEVLLNPVGLAPGQRLDLPGQRDLFLLPGPPREFTAILEEHILPWLKQHRAVNPLPVERVFQVTGMGESDLAQRLQDAGIPSVESGVELGFCVGAGRVEVRLTSWTGSCEVAGAEAQKMADLLGKAVYTEGRASMEEAVLEAFGRLGTRLSVAEVATQGLLGRRLAAVPFAKGLLTGSVVIPSYTGLSNLLDLPETLICSQGAASESVARRMASAVRIKCGADVGIAVSEATDGLDLDRDAGTCWVAWDDGHEADVRQLSVRGLSSWSVEWLAASSLDVLWCYANKRLAKSEIPST